MSNKEYSIGLGGTCNESVGRDDLLKLISKEIKEKCFNPVVDDGTPECQKIEQEVKKQDILHLFVLTPRLTGTYSIHEITSQTMKDKNVVLYVMQECDSCYEDKLPIKGDKGKLKSIKAQVDDLKEYPNFICLNSDGEDLEPYNISIEYLVNYLESHIKN